jgi:hypothetical protein
MTTRWFYPYVELNQGHLFNCLASQVLRRILKSFSFCPKKLPSDASMLLRWVKENDLLFTYLITKQKFKWFELVTRMSSDKGITISDFRTFAHLFSVRPSAHNAFKISIKSALIVKNNWTAPNIGVRKKLHWLQWLHSQTQILWCLTKNLYSSEITANQPC